MNEFNLLNKRDTFPESADALTSASVLIQGITDLSQQISYKSLLGEDTHDLELARVGLRTKLENLSNSANLKKFQ